MKFYITYLLTFLSLGVMAQGISFETQLSLKDINTKAATQNKYIFLDAYTTWCLPCKEMSQEVFPNKDLGDYIDGKFISTKVQMDKTAKDDEFVKSWYENAKMIEQKYQVNAYPTILLLTAEGDLIAKMPGYQTAVELQENIKKSLTGYAEFQSKYLRFKSDGADTAYLKALVKLGKEVGQIDKAHELAQFIINGFSEEELFKKENLEYAIANTKKSTDRLFPLLQSKASQIDEIRKALGGAKSKISKVIADEFVEPHTNEPKPDWTAIEARIKKKYGSLMDEQYLDGLKLLHSIQHENWESYLKFYPLYFKTFKNPLGLHLNNISWYVVEHGIEPKVLSAAIKVMKYNLEKFDKDNPGSMDTYANLLYKAGRKAEAIVAEQKAFEIESANAKKLGEQPDPVYAKTLEKMKKGVKIY